MPYSIGERGSHGCGGYPVVKTATGEVMGCHLTAKDAGKQLAALHMAEPGMKKDAANPSYTADPGIPGVGIKYPTSLTAARRSKNVIRKPKMNRQRSTQGDGSSASGATSSGGAGGSLG
jgi:hypothetical protein